MMAMRKNDTSPNRGIARKHSKSKVTDLEGVIRKQSADINRDKDSSSQLELKDCQKSVSEYPVIDRKRVESIRHAIEHGEYRIDSNRTAEKLLQLEEEIWGEDRD